MRCLLRASYYLLTAMLFSALPLLAMAQSDEEQARDQLQQLQRDITRINTEISRATSRRNTLQKQLREAELNEGKLQREIGDNQGAIALAEQELATQQSRRDELDSARVGQQARIAAELKAAWQMGNQGQLKVLLNQESPHTVARALAYYRYFFDARNALVTEYRETLRQLDEVRAQIMQTTSQLETRNTSLQEQLRQLALARSAREQAVASLNASITSKAGQLEQLELDRKELEDLLRAIEEAVVNLQVPENFQAFHSARGKMPWPVEGKPSNRYGRPRNEGKMKWQGLNFPATEGATVRAIHHGRVVYADWFRGSGLLLIIDHGDGYMSLYAHNQSLLRDVGEWVTGGTPVSTVGSSGGLARPALYFEIRHDGKPTDPDAWCRG